MIQQKTIARFAAMSLLICGFVFAAAPAHSSKAAERKLLVDVVTDDLTRDTKRIFFGRGVHVAWWLPLEFWEAVFRKSTDFSLRKMDDMFATLKPYSMLIVSQAELTPYGSYRFYEYDEIAERLVFSYTDAEGNRRAIEPLDPEKVPSAVTRIQNQVRPLVSSTLGPMGDRIHFLTFPDVDKDLSRMISPYEKGKINVQLFDRKTKEIMRFDVEMPLDSLFIPRKCPDGRDAHVSWNYCPWDGSKLPE